MQEINLPKLQQVEDFFMPCNKIIKKFNAPNLKKVGNSFFRRNVMLEEFYAPNLQEVGDYFLSENRRMNTFVAPNLQKAGYALLRDNDILMKFNAPKLPKNEKYSDCIRQLMEIEQNNPQEIFMEDIVRLDRKNQITTQEIRSVGRFFEKIRNIFKRDNSKDKTKESER